jgi:DNA repair exonuclease SbcCD ATPase subunit
MGTNYSKTSEGDRGIIQLSIDYIFQRMKEISQNNNCDYIVKASFIEIYNEEIRDLCNLKTPSKHIILREDPSNNSTTILGVTEMPVTDADDVLNLIWTGSLNRKTAATFSNDTSSRSHAIFTLNISKISTSQTVNFKINFIDLAGSERIKKSGVTGERFRESVSINSGLLSLSKVIMALAEESKRNSLSSSGSKNSVHIPYRESKLTRILKDSLGGNSLTLMIACVSPSSLNTEETINTLNYASFAKSIKIKPMLNMQSLSENNDLLVEELKRENENLKRELNKLKSSPAEVENYKLKGLIKILRGKLNSQSGSSLEEQNKLLQNSLANVDEIDENQNELEFNELDELNKFYPDSEQKIIEIEYAEKLQENLRLREENENLTSELQIMREKEEDYKTKLGHAAIMLCEDSKADSLSMQEYFNSNVTEKNHNESKHSSFKNKSIFVKKQNSIRANMTSDSTNENIENNYMNIVENDDSMAIECNINDSQILVNKGRNFPGSYNKKGSMSMFESNNTKNEPQVTMIFEKIKKLKEFQNSLKQKILENEIFKNKLVKNKNEEITYVKRDMLEKGKQLKNLEKIYHRNNELLEQSETTINTLKQELRNKSQEIKKIKNNPKIPFNNPNSTMTNLIPQSSTIFDPKSMLRRKKSYGSINDMNMSSNIPPVNNNLSISMNNFDPIKLKNNYVSGNLKNLNVSVSVNIQEEPKEVYFTLKNLMKLIEELIIQKHKLEKRAKYLQKEKFEFMNLIKVNEDRMTTKLKALNKLKLSLENIIKALEENNKEKITYSHKYQNTVNKISSITSRLEKMTTIQEITLKEISTNEELLKSQMSNIEIRIKEIKSKISNGKAEDENPSNMNLNLVENIEQKKESSSSESLIDLKNMLKEKDEKLVFIELDNMYKEKKILDLEKNLKEITLKFEDKIFALQFELKNLLKNTERNEFMISKNNLEKSLEGEDFNLNYNMNINSNMGNKITSTIQSTANSHTITVDVVNTVNTLDTVSNFNKKEYDTLYQLKSDKKVVKTRPLSRAPLNKSVNLSSTLSNSSNLPPTMKSATKTKTISGRMTHIGFSPGKALEQKSKIHIQSTINELPSSPRRQEKREQNSKSLTKVKSHDKI